MKGSKDACGNMKWDINKIHKELPESEERTYSLTKTIVQVEEEIKE